MSLIMSMISGNDYIPVAIVQDRDEGIEYYQYLMAEDEHRSPDYQWDWFARPAFHEVTDLRLK